MSIEINFENEQEMLDEILRTNDINLDAMEDAVTFNGDDFNLKLLDTPCQFPPLVHNDSNLDLSDTPCEVPPLVPPKLSITEEPKRFFNYSYESDLKKSAKSLVGNNSTKSKKSYTTIEFNGGAEYAGKQLFLLCTLCTLTADSNSDVNNKCNLSQHLLVNSETNAESTNGYCNPVFMPITADSEGNFVCQLKDYSILKTKPIDSGSILKTKYEELIKRTEEVESISDNEKDKIKIRVAGLLKNCLNVFNCKLHLTFTILYKATVTAPLISIAGPLLSNFFVELKILDINNINGHVGGGTEVTLTLSDATFLDNFKVRVFENKIKSKIILWSTNVDINNVDFEKNTITFNTPKYGQDFEDISKSDFNCFIQLVRLTDNIKSNKVSFVYQNPPIGIKRLKLV